MRRLLLAAILPAALAACGEDAVDDHAHSGEAWTRGMEQAFVEKDDAKMDGTGCSGVRVPDQGDFGGQVILTFDDGPNPATTPDIIATLRAFDAPATFFMKGANMRSEAAQAVIADLQGDPRFILANHSWSHSDQASLTLDRVETEITRTNAAITAAGATPTYFRFPYGSSTCATAEKVRDEHGMIITGWHIDSADWCFAAGGGVCPERTFRHVPDAYREDMAGFVMSQLRRSNGGIVLFHDIHRATADALPELMHQLTEAGYTFARLDDPAVLPLLHGVEPPARPFVGHGCETDQDCAFVSGDEVGFCHPAGVCTLSCAGYCPDRAGEAPTFCVADDLALLPDGPGGLCVSQASASNGDCADVPGTVDQPRDRFIGASSASARTARVCAPVLMADSDPAEPADPADPVDPDAPAPGDEG